jgi:hypothetical protein
MTINYYLFGEDAVRAYEEGGAKKVTSLGEPYATFMFIEGKTMSARLADTAIGWHEVVNLKPKDYFKLGILPFLKPEKVGLNGTDTSIEFSIWNGNSRDYIQGNFYGDVFEETFSSSEHASVTFDTFYNKIVEALMNEFTEAERTG